MPSSNARYPVEEGNKKPKISVPTDTYSSLDHTGYVDDDESIEEMMFEPLTRQKSSRQLVVSERTSMLLKEQQQSLRRSIEAALGSSEQETYLSQVIKGSLQRSLSAIVVPHNSKLMPFHDSTSSACLTETETTTSSSTMDESFGLLQPTESWYPKPTSQTPAITTSVAASPTAASSPPVARLSASTQPAIVEVAPGVKARFRGTCEATWNAILDGRITVATCLCCGSHLHCMDTVELVFCPQCSVISPVVDQSTATNGLEKDHAHQQSIGLGFTSEGILERMER